MKSFEDMCSACQANPEQCHGGNCGGCKGEQADELIILDFGVDLAEITESAGECEKMTCKRQ